MEPKQPLQTNAWPSAARTLLILGVVVGLALGIRATRGVTAPILLGLVVVIGASPLVAMLTKRRVPPVLAYIVSLLVIVIVIIALLFLMSYMIFLTRDLLPQIQDQLATLQQDLVETLAGWGIDISGVIEEQILKPENVVGWVSAALSALYGALKSVSLIVFIVAYMLVEVSGFRKRFYQAIGEDRPVLRRWLIWTRDTRSYLWITTVLAVVVAILNFVLLWALGVPHPFTWAFLSFVMSYIPNVGFLIALVPPLTLAVLQRSWGMVIGVLVGYIVINFVSDNIFKPRFLKTGMDLPAAVSFLSLLIWGFVLGPIGALLAVPMTMMVRTVLLEGSPETEPLALLLRSGGPGGPGRTKRRAWWWFRRGKGGGE
ncbi:MAG: AI-2E family transporter [Thermoleophilia bacterium]|nr:AI-2E family transporter [Thermoleophilia bacterium]